jgi:hypothetical protein
MAIPLDFDCLQTWLFAKFNPSLGEKKRSARDIPAEGHH